MEKNSVRFTPAPWKYNPKTSQVYAASQICKIWQFGDGEGKANAALIAAAPELYEALDWLVEVKDYKDTHGKDLAYEKAKETAWQKAREVLAKVRV